MSQSQSQLRITTNFTDFTPLRDSKDDFINTIKKLNDTFAQYLLVTNETDIIDARASLTGLSAELLNFLRICFKTKPAEQSLFSADLDRASATDQCKRTIPGAILDLTNTITRLSEHSALQNLHPEENPNDVIGHQLKTDCEEALKALKKLKTLIDQLNGTNDAKHEPESPSKTP